CPFLEPPVLETLSRLGLSPDTIRALIVVPLIEIAWADEKLEPPERDLLFDALRKHIPEDGAAFQMAEHWLTQQPANELYGTWQSYVAGLLGKMSASEQAAFKEQLVRHAEAVANSTGGIFGYGRMSPSKARVIHEIQAL